MESVKDVTRKMETVCGLGRQPSNNFAIDWEKEAKQEEIKEAEKC
jgi:hypothetical protein